MECELQLKNYGALIIQLAPKSLLNIQEIFFVTFINTYVIYGCNKTKHPRHEVNNASNGKNSRQGVWV